MSPLCRARWTRRARSRWRVTGQRSAPGTPWSAGEAAATRKCPRAIVENGPCASRSSQRARALGEMTAPTPCC